LFLLRRAYALLTLVTGAALFWALVWRSRQARQHQPDEHRQFRWLVWSALVIVGLYLLGSRVPMLLTGRSWLSDPVFNLLLLSLPAGLAISIARYRLFDIDCLVSRTLVYGALTVLIAGGYALVVGVAGLWSGAGQSVSRLVVIGVAAAIFQPVRDWLQRGAERLVYGARGDSDAVARRLSQQLQAAFDADLILDEVVQTVAQSLKLQYVALEAAEGGAPRTIAAVGRPGGPVTRFPLTYYGAALGALVVSPRAGEKHLATDDQQVLGQLAQHVSAAVHAAQTLQGLRRSRERLITAREEERRQLQRELQTEVAPHMAGLVLSADAISTALRQGRPPAELAPDLAALRDDAQQMTARVRALVHGLNEPAG
jgi:hypothetical protein